MLPGAKPPAEPLLFLKPPRTVIGPGEAIRYPAGVTRLDPEAELAVVIGRRLRHASLAESAEGNAGLTAFNDVRRPQRSAQRRSMDTREGLRYVCARAVEGVGTLENPVLEDLV